MGSSVSESLAAITRVGIANCLLKYLGGITGEIAAYDDQIEKLADEAHPEEFQEKLTALINGFEAYAGAG